MGGGEGGRIPLLEIENWLDLANLNFMFLVDMRFISKLWEIVLNQSEWLSGPRLRLFIFSKY